MKGEGGKQAGGHKNGRHGPALRGLDHEANEFSVSRDERGKATEQSGKRAGEQGGDSRDEPERIR
ncbi:MAG: hypothetical protein LC742_09145 [Acidobacteria bacterium]|nr:hypothetical protein [Acidobacteriota bacterium]